MGRSPPLGTGSCWKAVEHIQLALLAALMVFHSQGEAFPSGLLTAGRDAARCHPKALGSARPRGCELHAGHRFSPRPLGMGDRYDTAPPMPWGQTEGVPPPSRRGFPVGSATDAPPVPSPSYAPSPLSAVPARLSGQMQRCVGLGPGKRSRAMRDICLCTSSFSSLPPPQLSWGHGVTFLPGCGERREERGRGPRGPQLAAIPAPGAAPRYPARRGMGEEEEKGGGPRGRTTPGRILG